MPEITRTRVGITTYLTRVGPLNDASQIDALRTEFASCAEERRLQLVVDFTDVKLIDSHGLELLLEMQDQLVRLGGSLQLANPSALLRDVLRITGVGREISLIDSGEEPGEAPEPRRGEKRRIGEILREQGAATETMIEKALELQAESGRPMAQILIDEGWIDEKTLLAALSEQLGVPLVWLRGGIYDPAIVRTVPQDLTRRLRVLPLFRVGNELFLATSDPQAVPAFDTIQDLTGLKVVPVLACSDEIAATQDEAYGQGADLAEFMGDIEGDIELVESQANEDQDAIDQMAAGNPVINLINGVIQHAVRSGASDVHIEPGRSRCRIRVRVDGVLYPLMAPPMDVHPALVSRLKVMAKLDIAERRMPQDGRIQVQTQGRTVDLRFSSLPGIFGEKVVLRVLDKNESILDIRRLGLSESNASRFGSLLSRSYGLILVTGPTGSGKTTTLYAALNHLNDDSKNIVTIEDPVEYQIDAINQNQVKPGIGLGFAKFLKHILRQDPDIVMVGEIRERETAEITIQAALTGHLVLSTLHTNDSIGAVTRLLDMGVEPFLLSSALLGVMAQRLVRTVCSECKTTYSAPPDALAAYGVEPKDKLQLTRGRGCSACYDSGYKDRIPIHEILAVDPGLQNLIVSNPSRDVLDEYLREHEIASLVDDGIARVIEGRTTLEEVLRVVNS